MSLTLDRNNTWSKRLVRNVLGPRILHIELNDPTFKDTSLFVGLHSLQWLNLNNTSVSDLSPLAGLKRLRTVFLYSTPVCDLKPLAGVYKLGFVGVCGTKVTKEQVDNLEQELPKCKVLNDPFP